MPSAFLTRSSASLARTTALLTIALATWSEVAAATSASTHTITRRAHHAAHAKSKAHARTHAKTHAVAHARVHARHHAHLHALSTVASADAAEIAGPSLRGSHAAVDRAYDVAVRGGLPFVHSDSELERRASAGEYVPLSRSAATYRLKGVGSPFVRPATRDFVTGFAADYAKVCGEPLTVTSAMRPTSIRLRNSVQKSVHPTGMAVDLRASRTGCRSWMRTTLLAMERRGVIDATEEHHPAHFHVVVMGQ